MSVGKIEKLLNKNPQNITKGLKEDTLRLIGEDVLEGYTSDEQSREQYLERINEGIKLATQVIENKNTPWPGAANVKYPLVTEGALRFSAEAYPALIDSGQPVNARVVGDDPEGVKTDSALRVSKHMSYQILEEMEEWESDMDELLILVAIIGCMFKKTYRGEDRNYSDVISPRDLVINYYTRKLEYSPRITHKLYFQPNEVEEKQRAGLWRDVELDEPSTPREDREGQSRTGFEPPTQDAPHTILECHTWYDLDEDGYKEPWIITIEESSGEVLRIMPRFSFENIEADANNEIVRIIPDQYFTKFSFIPNPERSVYDLGLYHIAGPLNEAANTAINQLLDAGTLSNLQSGFISKGLRIRGGEKKFKPGEWKPVNATMDDLKKGIFPLPVREPSNVLFQLLGTLIDAGQRLTSTTDALSGDSQQHNQKANAALANIERGMKVFNGIYKRLHRGLKWEFKKLYKLNAESIIGEEYFTVLDSQPEGAKQAMQQGAQPQEIAQKVTDQDYNIENLDIVPTSNPNVVTEQQQLQKASALFELAQQGLVNPAIATRRILEAQGQPGIEQLLETPDPQPSFEQQIEQEKLKLENAKLQAEIIKDDKEQRIKALAAEAKAIRDIAEAEGVEAGQQMERYKQIIELIRQEGEDETKREELAMKERVEANKNAGTSQ